MAIPDDVLPPEMLPEAAFVLGAFDDLSSDRDVGMGLGPIKWSSIVRWAEVAGWSEPDEVAFLTKAIRTVDAAWLEKNRPKKA